jgi:hypothetical protein
VAGTAPGTKRFGSLHVDGEFELARLLDRQVGELTPALSVVRITFHRMFFEQLRAVVARLRNERGSAGPRRVLLELARVPRMDRGPLAARRLQSRLQRGGYGG